MRSFSRLPEVPVVIKAKESCKTIYIKYKDI